MKRKVVFMDIDGTLMGHNGVSGRVIEAIRRARAAGHLFFVCTGRSLGNMPVQLLEADYLDGYVMGCGMHCLYGKQIVYHERIEKKLVLMLAEYSLEKRLECWYEGENCMLATYSENTSHKCANSIEEFSRILESEPVTKMTILGSYAEEYSDRFAEWFDIYDMGTYSDVIMRGVTKASGMQHVLDYLGVDREDCIGVGDSLNDLPMIEYAGLGVAMGNAPDSVKERADAVTDTCADDGLAAMIEKYLLN